MPRTISTKPEYSVRWWSERDYIAPERDVFAVLRRVVAYRLTQGIAPIRGVVRLRDARTAARGFPKLREAVQLIVTSPPYLDTTDFAEDQWLRLWFLGGPERPRGGSNKDDRHTRVESYWRFLSEAWAGCAPLIRQGATLVIRVGGTRLQKMDILAGRVWVRCGKRKLLK